MKDPKIIKYILDREKLEIPSLLLKDKAIIELEKALEDVSQREE